MLKKTTILTPVDPRWQEFTDRLDGDEGCKFYFDELDEICWTCHHDLRFSRKILSTYDDVDVEATLEYFRQNGGCCDCEVLFNVENSTQNNEREMPVGP